MKKKLFYLLFLLPALTLTNCANTNDSSNNDSISEFEEEKQIVFYNVPEKAINAELGQKCDIPEVTAKRGTETLTVEVVVKDSTSKKVELLGRNTRFMVEDINGYTITYTAFDDKGTLSTTINVTVSDSTGPTIKFDIDVSNLCVNKGSVVKVPTPTWQDNGGIVKNESYKVTHNGSDVAINDDSFVASEYGIYKIEYSASDEKSNTSTVIVEVNCARMIVLNDFNTLDNVWANETISSLSTEYAIEGNSFKVTGDNNWNLIAVYPKYYDLSGFNKLQLSVYASKDIDTGEEGLYLLNQKYTLSEGLNTITITAEEFASQYPNGKIPSSNPDYYDSNYIWFQLKSDGGTIYMDNFVGIFDNYTTDTIAPTIDFGKTITHDQMTVMEKDRINVPTAIAYDNSMEDVKITYKVFNKSNEDITSLVETNNYVALNDETYTITYTAIDASNNVALKSVIVSVEPKNELPDTSKEVYFPSNRYYDILNDFETIGVDWCTAESYEYSTEHVMNGDYSVKLSTTGADKCIVLKMLKNGQRLTNDEIKKYDYIQVYAYSESDNARLDFYSKTNTLNAGPNVITISSADLLAEIAKADNVYDSTGGFYFQLTTGTVYLDAIIGIYSEDYDPNASTGDSDTPAAKPAEIINYYPTDRTYDILQSFDSADCVDTWFFANSEGLTTNYAISEKAFHLSSENAAWAKLPIIMLKNGNTLTSSDWESYDYFKIAIYSESQITFAFLNKTYTLNVGYNVLTISKDDMLAQLSANAECYANNYFYFQVNGTNVSIYLDVLIGVYPAN